MKKIIQYIGIAILAIIVVVIVGVVGSREDDGHAGGDLVKGVVADPPEDVFGFVSRMSEVNDLPVS